MSTPVNPAGGSLGPADLAELQATDALLDRLALGTTTSDDREDALVGALVALRTELEEPGGDPGVDMARLLEVLGDRPLYLVDGEADEAVAELPIHLGRTAESDDRLVVDLNELAAGSPDGGPTPVPAPERGELVGAAAFAARAARVAAQLREKAPGQALLPAASFIVLLVLALGSGVSGVVTGDPMAPVSGVGKVLSAIPGVGPANQRTKADLLTASLQQADAFVKAPQPDIDRARQIVNQAQAKVNDLPSEQQPSVQARIDGIQQAIQSVAATPPPSSAPSPTASAPTTVAPSPSATATAPTDSPTPTVAPTTSAAASTDSSGSGTGANTSS